MEQTVITGNRWWAFLLVGVVALAAWSVFLRPVHERAYVYTWDSAAYIDCARSILDGRGFMQRKIDSLSPQIWEPISWWPPGYPMLVACVAWVGVGLPHAGVAVALISAAAAILCLCLITLRLFHWSLALLMVLSLVLMPCFLNVAVTCMSDASYYALATASVFCLFQWSCRDTKALRWVVAAGALAGLAWGVRNVAIALLATSGLWLLLHAEWQRGRRAWLALLAWGAGAACGLGPFVIRNLLTFGSLNAYDMPRSERSVWQNIVDCVAVVAQDLTGSDRIGRVFENGVMVASVATVCLVVAGCLVGVLGWSGTRSLLDRHRVVLFCFLLIGAHLAVVIAARSSYRWGELIVSRHTMQTYWLFWIASGLSLLAVLRRIGCTPISAQCVAAVLFSLLAVQQVRETKGQIRRTPPGSQVSIQNQFGPAAAEYLSQDVRPDQIVLAHYADLLRTHCNINSRKIPSVAQYYKLEKLTREKLDESCRRGFVWGFVICDLKGTENGDYDEIVRDLVRNPDGHPEFARVAVDGPALILKYVGPLITDIQKATL